MYRLKSNKLGKRQPPKKSASAYIIFGKEFRSRITSQNPDLKISDTVRQIASAWNGLSAKDKQKYHSAARKGNISILFISTLDRERYDKELQILSNFDLRKPKKCLSAYMIFVREVSDFNFKCAD
jgi:hypothetical protein